MKNKYFNYFTVFFAISWIFYSLYNGEIFDKEIEKYGIITVGKITKFKGASSRAYLRYHYYVNNHSFGSDSPRDEKGEKIGEFYKVIYSSKNPEKSRIQLDEKITDTTSILNAGFSREDIISK